MALLTRKTEAERFHDAVLKDRQTREKQIEKARHNFFRSPAGQARMAFERGDQVFQTSYDVANQEAIIVAMVGSRTATKTADPTLILNSVCVEGWELINGSFVFAEEGQQSRDKFMSSGQNVAIKGKVIGYYLFKRCEANRCEMADPWELAEALL